MIRGTITRQGKYSDGKDWCEIIILSEDKNKLPHKLHRKTPIDLLIGQVAHLAGVHETKQGMVWVSSVLYEKGGKKEKTRLVDALQTIGLHYRDHVILKIDSSGCYRLEPDNRPRY